MSTPSPRNEARERLIVALDVSDVTAAGVLVDSLGEGVRFYKVGLELWSRPDGVFFAKGLVDSGHRLFADLKLHDIPETVARATEAVASLGATFVTTHGPPSAVRAAAERRGYVTLLGVTVLTSMDAAEWRLANGLDADPDLGAVVLARGRVLLESGCGGLVCSPLEVAKLRAAHPDAILVTPGVRPAGSAAGDQKRVATPRDAVAAGADYLVVGRPIRDAADPRATVEAIVDEIEDGLRARSSRS